MCDGWGDDGSRRMTERSRELAIGIVELAAEFGMHALVAPTHDGGYVLEFLDRRHGSLRSLHVSCESTVSVLEDGPDGEHEYERPGDATDVLDLVRGAMRRITSPLCPACECGGCDWTDAPGDDDHEEYAVVRWGRCGVPWESEVEHACGLRFARHRRNMLRKQTGGEFRIFRLQAVE